MNEERLEKLAVFLDTLPDKLWDFRRWVMPGKLLPMEALEVGGGCGTTACAVGWLPAIFPDDWEWETYMGMNGKEVTTNGVRLIRRANQFGSWSQHLTDAAEFFDIEYSQAGFLFTPHEHEDCCDDEECPDSCAGDDCPLPGDESDAKTVAEHIRRFIAEGGEY